MDVAPSLVQLGLEGLVFHDLEETSEVLPEVALEDLFVELGRWVVDHLLGLRVKCLYFVSNPGVHILIKHLEHIVFLPHVDLYIREVLFSLKLLPKLKVFDLFILHEFFEFDEKLEQFADEQVADHIRQLHLPADVHCLLRDRCQEDVDVPSMQQILGISLECLYLLLPQSFLVANHFFLGL